MKALMHVAAVALAVSPILALAQSDQNQPVTRAEVRSELIQLEKAGYDPSTRDPYYPNNLQAAEARVQAGDVAAKPGMTSYGPSVEGTSGSGATAPSSSQ
ncbi:purine nucleoside phosphorylase [Caballeronia choica]|jgi:Domain of unknown function (DUF4148)|uniref:Purine nucleoside phosphorylase n=1 Tax=Caballeronia choica TaxID=326476 RepID=A0A158KV55_9BURK|nr:DUF4148 domain-containing protein [Caballeronia choica]SAL84490.1 purine nucleoside phosphorylase [Caballeronia choica]